MRPLLAGLIGAITVTALHELLRRTSPDAPRMDVVGMRAVAKTLSAAGITPPAGPALHQTALGGDVAANASYYSLAGMTGHPLLAGTVLGVAAGLGAVILPEPLGLGRESTKRTAQTIAMTIGLYTAGGVAAGLAAERMR